jgi:hypothetical protein
MKRRSARPVVFTIIVISLLGGCTSGAPSFELFGAYFPAWMLCGLAGILGGVIARTIFVASDLADVLPHQLTVCTSIGIIVALGVWLLLYL